MFALRGTSIYPDATFTLRLSVGTISGYTEGGTRIPPGLDHPRWSLRTRGKSWEGKTLAPALSVA